MITRRGVGLVATAIFTFLLARLTQVGWLYLLDAMLWGIVLFSLVLPWLFVASLTMRRRLARREGRAGVPGPSEGEVVQLELGLENGKPWPRYFLSASYLCSLASPDESDQRFFVPRLAGGGATAMVTSVRCHRRGMHHLGPVTVQSKAPFSLFRRRRRLPAPMSVLVYPRVYPLRRLPLLDGMQGTATRPRKTRTGQEVAGSRPFVPGDPLRHLHWRNTARLGTPFVKEFEDMQENTLTIVFDSSRDIGEGQGTVLEYFIKLAASVAGYAIEQGASVRVLTGRLPDHDMLWEPLLKELALLEAGHGHPLPTLVESVPAGSKVLALVSEEDVSGMEALGRRGGEMSGMAVVVLEGFGPDGPMGAGSVADTQRRIGVPVLRCRHGDLQGALSSLEQMEWSTAREGEPAMALLRHTSPRDGTP